MTALQTDPWQFIVPAREEPPPSRTIRPPRKPMSGSPQQEAFWGELQTGYGHVVLEARAGTGKSTSCREGMWRLLDKNPKRTIRYCCFNKKIADEFGAKCPPGVEVGTMHRFGFMALQTAFGSTLDQNKTYTLLDSMEGGAILKRYVRKTISKLVSLAKNHGLQPDDPKLETRLAEFIIYYDVETWRQQDAAIRWTMRVLDASAEMTSLVDFDDMLWLTIVHPVAFPSVDDLFIDEAQDLNPVQHLMAERLSGSGRTVVVGDTFQSIYAFRGADSDSMPLLKERLSAKVMPLTVTWRCPRSHVEIARRLVPDFEAAPEAPEGTLIEGPRDLIDAASPGSLVLCRANAPIVQACLRQIARRRPAIVRGRSIGDALVAVFRKVEGDYPCETMASFGRGLDTWRAKEIGRLDARDGTENLIEAVQDKAACLHAIGESCGSPPEIPGVIGQLFDDSDSANRVTFSSVHRAKGSEAREVTYLQIPYSEKRDKLRPPQPWEEQQRRNLRYVAVTRSLDSLTLVS